MSYRSLKGLIIYIVNTASTLPTVDAVVGLLCPYRFTPLLIHSIHGSL